MNKDSYTPDEHRPSPSPSSRQSKKKDLSFTLQVSFHDCLETRVINNLTTLYFGDIAIVSFSPQQQEFGGRILSLHEQDMSGYLFFNTDFFHTSYVRQKPVGYVSQMRNLAKTFFTVNGENYVALVQYLFTGGRSSEHFHTLPESIVQLAGQSTIVLRDTNQDTQFTIYELYAGDILCIPPQKIHLVRANDGGSITIPIKQTLITKSDTCYHPYSKERLEQELRFLLEATYTSGNEVVTAFRDYTQPLLFDQAGDAEKILRKLLREDRYTNLRLAFDKLLSS